MPRPQRAGGRRAEQHRRPAAGVVACLLLIVAGCTGGPTDSPGTVAQASDPQRNELSWESAQVEATSDFEREVLADRTITAEEYAEAHQRWLACMEEIYPPETSGVEITLILKDEGLYEFRIGASGGSLPEDYDLNDQQCMIGTIIVIGPMYDMLLVNPELRPIVEVIIECLQRHGLVDESYTEANFLADQLKDDPTIVNIRPDGTEERVRNTEFDPTQVTDLDMDSPEVRACKDDPSS